MQNTTKEEYIATLRRRSKGFSRGSSKYRGVARHHYNGRWEARIRKDNVDKYLYLGTYETQEEAAEAYDLAALQLKGPNAVTNFDKSLYTGRLKNNELLGFHQPQLGEVDAGQPSPPQPQSGIHGQEAAAANPRYVQPLLLPPPFEQMAVAEDILIQLSPPLASSFPQEVAIAGSLLQLIGGEPPLLSTPPECQLFQACNMDHVLSCHSEMSLEAMPQIPPLQSYCLGQVLTSTGFQPIDETTLMLQTQLQQNHPHQGPGTSCEQIDQSPSPALGFNIADKSWLDSFLLPNQNFCTEYVVLANFPCLDPQSIGISSPAGYDDDYYPLSDLFKDSRLEENSIDWIFESNENQNRTSFPTRNDGDSGYDEKMAVLPKDDASSPSGCAFCDDVLNFHETEE
ncbi:hypothetical protein CRG98_029880 [Punica granatum]|nr:hypothetical protein CRG98_029880 [Punica granatum]